jgi:hypothetical protein
MELGSSSVGQITILPEDEGYQGQVSLLLLVTYSTLLRGATWTWKNHIQSQTRRFDARRRISTRVYAWRRQEDSTGMPLWPSLAVILWTWAAREYWGSKIQNLKGGSTLPSLAFDVVLRTLKNLFLSGDESRPLLIRQDVSRRNARGRA